MKLGLTDRDRKLIEQYADSDVTLGKASCTGGDTPAVSEAECRQWRERALGGVSSGDLADEYSPTNGTIRKHLRGDCDHGGGLCFNPDGKNYRAGEWVRADD